MKILGTGLSGMVGQAITSFLSNTYQFEDLSLDSGVDIRNQEHVFERVKNSKAEIVLHLAAKTNVDECEKDREDDLSNMKYQISNIKYIIKRLKWQEWQEKTSAFAINTVGTINIAKACKQFNKKLIYISTDFVFDGKDKDHLYTEDDKPNPLSWYAYTKYIGELIVQEYNSDNLIVRITYPYGQTRGLKKSFVELIINAFQNNQEINAPVDNVYTPTFIDDIACGIEAVIFHESKGTMHIVGSTCLSSYDSMVAIALYFGYDKNLVKKTTFGEYYHNKAPRPQWGRTSNDKIINLGVKMKTFEEGLQEMKKSLLSKKADN